MIYVDTSVIVAGFTVESSTLAAQSWLEAHHGERLATSLWVKTEFYSALAMKRRLKEIDDLTYTSTTRQFLKMSRDTLFEFAISRSHFETAAEIVAQYELKLRAADALHLAIAADNGATLCTLDQRLFDAAKALGIACMMP
ncbi:MAG: type II toxin-antitoxin system VapC family toxin [Beijerinckiaceae bacterium]